MKTITVQLGIFGQRQRNCAACHDPYYSWDMYLCKECGPKGYKIIELV